MRLTRLTVLIMAVITIAGFYMLYRYLDEDLESQTFQATEESMVDTSHILAALVESQISNDEIQTDNISNTFQKTIDREFKSRIYKHTKTHVGANIYITDQHGVILYDSKHPDRIGEIFLSFNDVNRSLQGKYGARSSRTDEDKSNSSILYVGAPIYHKGKIIGVLTVYKPQQDVLPFIHARRKWIILSLSMIAVGVLVFTIAVFTWIFRPIGKLTDYANAMTRGERPSMPKLGRGREVNTLGNALKEMREALQGTEYIEHYTQMLTHELKSPLAAIRGASELLQEDMPEEQRKKFLSNIERETARSQRIIDGLLKLSRLEAQSELQRKVTVYFHRLTSKLLAEKEHALENKNIQLNIDVPENVTIEGDCVMIKSAIANLLENAIRFSPEGGTITIKGTFKNGVVNYSISDQGPGIPDFALPRIFEHFYSLSETGNTQKSSGLGLAFVKEVAELHQGSVTLENIEPTGATATLIFQGK